MELSTEKHISDKPVYVSFEPIDTEDKILELRADRTYKIYDFNIEE
jgi:hypothetical protein